MIAARRATAEDMPLLVEMMRRFYAESGFSLDGEWATDSFTTLLADDSKGAAWLVFKDSKPAGYVVLTLRHSMEYGGSDAFIDDLYVRPDLRRVGLGREALNALFAECERRGVHAVHVEAGRDNVAAQKLYRSFGLGVPDAARQLLTVRIGHKAPSLQTRP